MMKPVCPFCNKTMVARYFKGYYERFPLWQCGCEVIPESTIMAGSYSYVDDGVSYEEEYGVKT
jgi:hypothetical protein